MSRMVRGLRAVALTRKQTLVYIQVVKFFARHGRSPTMSELSAEIPALGKKNNVWTHVTALESTGLLSMDGRRVSLRGVNWTPVFERSPLGEAVASLWDHLDIDWEASHAKEEELDAGGHPDAGENLEAERGTDTDSQGAGDPDSSADLLQEGHSPDV